jgi:outer membrane lipoprotein-sorting protein
MVSFFTALQMNRRKFVLAAVAAPLILSACATVTDSLNESIKENDYRTYKETVSSVLISADGKKLVFLGPEYHYIFDAPEHFAALMDSPLHAKMRAQFNQFDAGEDGSVTGNITIYLDAVLADEMDAATQLGFSKTYSGTQTSRRIELNGKRYSAKGFDASKVDQKLLRNSYEVSVREKNPFNAAKALYVLTPITVAADGVMTLLTVPLLPFLIIALAGGGGLGHF